jgi:hypothetical protein
MAAIAERTAAVSKVILQLLFSLEVDERGAQNDDFMHDER